MKVAFTIPSRDHDVVLFDLDGVLTRTASVHAAAWKRLFDGFVEQRATKAGKPFVPFDIETDYSHYVDGKPRYDGVADFLGSRGIKLPLGAPDDGPDVQSVRALGNLKHRYFLEQLEQHGVEPYEPAIALVRAASAGDQDRRRVLQQQMRGGARGGRHRTAVRRASGRVGSHPPLLHDLEVGPILKTRVPVSQAALGLVTIFILCWFAGVLIAGIYNLGVRLGKQ